MIDNSNPPNGKRPCQAGRHRRAIRPPIRTPKPGFAKATRMRFNKGDLYTARLTLDITPAMRARIKVSAFTQGVTVADLLRGLLEREFPEHRRENTP